MISYNERKPHVATFSRRMEDGVAAAAASFCLLVLHSNRLWFCFYCLPPAVVAASAAAGSSSRASSYYPGSILRHTQLTPAATRVEGCPLRACMCGINSVS